LSLKLFFCTDIFETIKIMQSCYCAYLNWDFLYFCEKFIVLWCNWQHVWLWIRRVLYLLQNCSKNMTSSVQEY